MLNILGKILGSYTVIENAIVKGDEAQRQEYIDKCLAVKAKYPKG